jgi:hypothetical protein
MINCDLIYKSLRVVRSVVFLGAETGDLKVIITRMDDFFGCRLHFRQDSQVHYVARHWQCVDGLIVILDYRLRGKFNRVDRTFDVDSWLDYVREISEIP